MTLSWQRHSIWMLILLVFSHSCSLLYTLIELWLEGGAELEIRIPSVGCILRMQKASLCHWDCVIPTQIVDLINMETSTVGIFILSKSQNAPLIFADIFFQFFYSYSCCFLLLKFSWYQQFSSLKTGFFTWTVHCMSYVWMIFILNIKLSF